ncbi:MAG: hypothetical protein MJY98_02830 [Fibrobacter sp.]|nr:hypothetical protein [Fibrobacter sp.]
MRKLPIIATTLLCSSFALAQDFEDYGADEVTSSAEQAYDELDNASSEEAPAEEPADLYGSYEPAAEEPASYEEPAPAEEAVAEAPAEEPALANSIKKETAPAKGPATAWPVTVGAPASLAPEAQIAAVEDNLDSLTNNMESTLMGKDDLPLAVSGYMAFRLKNFHYSEPSPYVKNDLARTNVDAVLNMNIVAMPNSYMTLWTNLSMPFDLSGLYNNYLGSKPTDVPTYDQRVQFDHSTDFYTTTVNEEMNFGVDIRAGVFGAYVTAGGVIWANSSPLTMWERETAPRFAWQYELFEDEKTVSTYYKEKVFKPVKEGGRAFWTNRSFGGVFASVYQLPFDMKAQFLVSQPADADIGTRDGLRMYGGQPGELEMSGSYDFRGSIYHGRIAKEKIADNLTVGLNYMGITFDNDIVYEDEFRNQWITYGENHTPTILNTHVVSADVKGNITPKLYLMADVAVSMTDSVNFYQTEDAADYNPENISTGYLEDAYESALNTPQVGVYVKAQSKYVEGWPMTVEAIYLPKEFYSPYSLSNPSRFAGWRRDEFYLNGGSLRYSPNMAGINFKLEPTFNRGYFDFQYGLHTQVEKGQDVVFFNYRLNGRNVWESSNSWTKHKPLFIADSGNGDGSGYVARVGTELESGSGIKQYRQQGGLYGGTWEMWESFVAYEDAEQIISGEVPEHTKWSSFMSFMGGYDIGGWFGTDRTIMMTGYASVSGVSTEIAPLAYSESQSGMLLWSFFGQFEPSIAVTPTFHMVGIFGLETFRSDKAYTAEYITENVSKKDANGGTNYLYGKYHLYYYKKSPINYLETALGVGFDWDFSDRVGLHARYKFMTHSDETVSENDWHSHYISAEVKAWF